MANSTTAKRSGRPIAAANFDKGQTPTIVCINESKTPINLPAGKRSPISSRPCKSSLAGWCVYECLEHASDVSGWRFASDSRRRMGDGVFG